MKLNVVPTHSAGPRLHRPRPEYLCTRSSHPRAQRHCRTRGLPQRGRGAGCRGAPDQDRPGLGLIDDRFNRWYGTEGMYSRAPLVPLVVLPSWHKKQGI